MDDRRRNPDLHHITHLRRTADRALQLAVALGGIAGWLFIYRNAFGA